MRRKRRQSRQRARRKNVLRQKYQLDICTDSEEESDHSETPPNDAPSHDAPSHDTTQQTASNVTFTTLNDYADDDFDQNYVCLPDRSSDNEFASLFDGGDVSVRRAAHLLAAFLVDSNLDKRTSTRLLQLIKSLLPRPNRLPKTWSCLMKMIGQSTKSVTTFLCGKCHQR
jgi:hypothetical protein